MIPIPDYILFDTDQTFWGKDFDPADTTHIVSQSRVNTYIAYMGTIYRTRTISDAYLWRTFREDFDD
jgi:hypothetical protein